MNWPEAIYKIVVEGGSGLLIAIVLLAMFTNFFRDMFNRGQRGRIPVFPPGLKLNLRDVIESIDEYNDSGLAPTTAQTKLWARALEDAIDNAREYLEDE